MVTESPGAEPGFKVQAASHTGFVDAIGSADYAGILERLDEPVGQIRAVQLRTLGGMMAEVPNDATAFAHRYRKIMVNIATLYEQDNDRSAAQTWVADLTKRLHGDDQEGYVNFLGDEGPERIRQAYPGQTWDRLRTIKSRYDPTNLFRMNQNIPPIEG